MNKKTVTTKEIHDTALEIAEKILEFTHDGKHVGENKAELFRDAIIAIYGSLDNFYAIFYSLLTDEQIKLFETLLNQESDNQRDKKEREEALWSSQSLKDVIDVFIKSGIQGVDSASHANPLSTHSHGTGATQKPDKGPRER